MPLTRSVPLVTPDKALNQDIDGLLSGVAWNLTNITYSFPDSSSDYGNVSGFQSFTTEQQDAVRTILHSIEGYTNITFQELTGADDKNALIRYAETKKTSDAYTYYPSEKDTGGDAWFTNSGLYDHPTVGSYAYTGMMHETGHALGLKHSFEKAGGGLVPAGHDSLEYTVMSYSSYDGANDWHAAPGDFPQTLMMYDIAALQYMYGPNFETNKGDTTYTWSPATGAMTATQGGSVVASVDAPGTDTIFMTIWDGGGKDTYDFSAFSTNLRIDLRPGEWVQTDTLNNSQTADLGYSDGVADPHYAVGNIANALTYKTYNPDGSVKAENPSSLIENAKGGSGDDVFIANQAVNGFTGGTGHDTFQWLSLADAQNTLVGGGMDTITDLSAGDKIDLTAISGLDSSEVSYVKDGDGYNIQGNIDGVGAPEFSIHVSGNYVSANWSTHSDWLFA